MLRSTPGRVRARFVIARGQYWPARATACDVSHCRRPACRSSFCVFDTQLGSGERSARSWAKLAPDGYGTASRSLRGLTLLTFFLAGSVTPWTMRLSSLRMALAATPVVADLKSCVWECASSIVAIVRAARRGRERCSRAGWAGRNFGAAVSSKQRIVQAIQNNVRDGIPRPASVMMPESAAFAAKARGKARVHVQRGQAGTAEVRARFSDTYDAVDGRSVKQSGKSRQKR